MGHRALRTTPSQPAPLQAARLVALGLCLLAMVAVALATPGTAAAHAQKNRQGRYAVGVDNLRVAAEFFVNDEDHSADYLLGLAAELRGCIPPENEQEQAKLKGCTQEAGMFRDQGTDAAVAMIAEQQKIVNKWERKVKPWFRTAPDKRKLEKGVDAYMQGLAHLLHETHGDLIDAAGMLADENVDGATDTVAVAQFAIAVADKEMTDAVTALRALLN